IVQPVEGNGVIAVYSLATGKPIKVGNFDPIWQGFEDSENYQRWRFGIANLPPPGAKTVGQGNQKSIEDNRRELNATNPTQGGDAALNRERMNQLNQDDAANESRKP
ncbi:MAG: hypothetical protein HYZ45_09985, partial [Burkholderiales bacterium]|nr:hypothetical protein [Burkholderiales bacterium]